MKCPYCLAGDKPIRLARQYIHRVGFRNVVCDESGFGQSEPGDWSGHSPREWAPRRLKRRDRDVQK